MRGRFSDFLYYNDSIVKLVITLVFIIVVMCLLGSYTPSNQQAMDERANAVAQCESIGGNFGGDKCYVNGIEVNFSEPKMLDE